MKLKCNYIIVVIIAIVVLKPAVILSQDLALKASFDGIPLQGFKVETDGNYGGALDFNRDGITDQSFIDRKKNIVIVNGANHQQKWVVPISVLYETVTLVCVCGFYEMDGDPSTTEIVIAKNKGNRFWSPIIVAAELDPSSPKLQEDDILAKPNYFLLGIKDIDNDGKDDIIVANTSEQRIEIWSY